MSPGQAQSSHAQSLAHRASACSILCCVKNTLTLISVGLCCFAVSCFLFCGLLGQLLLLRFPTAVLFLDGCQQFFSLCARCFRLRDTSLQPVPCEKQRLINSLFFHLENVRQVCYCFSVLANFFRFVFVSLGFRTISYIHIFVLL